MSDELVPVDWQTRSLAFLIDLILYVALFYGLESAGHFVSVTTSMIYIVFRDGLFAGQSLGKKVMGIRVVHTDGREISYVDSSFRNVLFLIYLLLPLAIVVETVVMLRSADRRRLGDRIARTLVIRKAAVPSLA